MSKHNLVIVPCVLIFCLMLFYCSGDQNAYNEAAGNDYASLVRLFNEFKEFEEPAVVDGLPDYSASTMKAQYNTLKKFQRRLASMDPRDWPVSE